MRSDTGQSLFKDLTRADVTFSADDDRLVADDPAGALSDVLWKAVRQCKAEILAIVRKEDDRVRARCLAEARRQGWPAVKVNGRITPWRQADWERFCRDGPLDRVAALARAMS